MLKELAAVLSTFEDGVSFFVTCIRREASTQNGVVDCACIFFGRLA
jgi:hypothetical protein